MTLFFGLPLEKMVELWKNGCPKDNPAKRGGSGEDDPDTTTASPRSRLSVSRTERTKKTVSHIQCSNDSDQDFSKSTSSSVRVHRSYSALTNKMTGASTSSSDSSTP
eukprot:Pgem_evm1s12809